MTYSAILLNAMNALRTLTEAARTNSAAPQAGEGACEQEAPEQEQTISLAGPYLTDAQLRAEFELECG